MSEFKKRDCPFTHTDEICTGRCSGCDNYKLYNCWVQIETMETIKCKMRDEHLLKAVDIIDTTIRKMRSLTKTLEDEVF